MSSFKKLYTTYLTQKNDPLNIIHVGNIETDINIDDEFINRYKDSLTIIHEKEQMSEEKQQQIEKVKTLVSTIVAKDGLTQPPNKFNKLDPESLIYQTYLLINNWNPDIDYNCPISLQTDIVFSDKCKPNFILEFKATSKQEQNFDNYHSVQFRNLLNLKQQISLFRRAIQLSGFNNNLFQQGQKSSSNEKQFDFTNSDKLKLYLLKHANFGRFQDLDRQVYGQSIDNCDETIKKTNQEAIQQFTDLNPPTIVEMDDEIKKILGQCLEKYPKLKQIFGTDYDAGFIQQNNISGDSFIDPFESCGHQADYPVLNISLGCSSIVLMGNQTEIPGEDEAPKCLMMESGSVYQLGYDAINSPRIVIPPYSKSFNMQGKVLQESTRIARIQDTQTKEIDLQQNLSPDDKDIVDLMRNCRIDLQLRQTKQGRELQAEKEKAEKAEFERAKKEEEDLERENI